MRNYLFALFYVAMLSSCSSCNNKNVTNTGVGDTSVDDTSVDDTSVDDACIRERQRKSKMKPIRILNWLMIIVLSHQIQRLGMI